jgi:hypothetical protein
MGFGVMFCYAQGSGRSQDVTANTRSEQAVSAAGYVVKQ